MGRKYSSTRLGTWPFFGQLTSTLPSWQLKLPYLV